MSKATLRDDLVRRVRRLNTEAAKAERKIASSDPHASVKLRVELRMLERRVSRLEARLKALDGQTGIAIGDIKAELLEDADHILTAFRSWFERY